MYVFYDPCDIPFYGTYYMLTVLFLIEFNIIQHIIVHVYILCIVFNIITEHSGQRLIMYYTLHSHLLHVVFYLAVYIIGAGDIVLFPPTAT